MFPWWKELSGGRESIIRVSPRAFEFLFLLQPAGIGSEVRRYFLCSSFFSFAFLASAPLFAFFFFQLLLLLRVFALLLTLLRLLVGPFEVMLI